MPIVPVAMMKHLDFDARDETKALANELSIAVNEAMKIAKQNARARGEDLR